jgi:hypothetical protein
MSETLIDAVLVIALVIGAGLVVWVLFIYDPSDREDW